MVLKMRKKVKTCQEKADIWLRFSFDLHCIWIESENDDQQDQLIVEESSHISFDQDYYDCESVEEDIWVFWFSFVIVWWCSMCYPPPVRTVGSEITGHALE